MQKKLYLIAALEKFASNGFRALILVYLIKFFHLEQYEALDKAALILGLNYLLPFTLGLVLDRVPTLRLGLREAAVILSLAILTPVFFGSDFFDFSVSAILIVTSLLRPMVPLLIRESMTAKEDEGPAFTKMYIAYNWGTVLGTLMIAILGEVLGWNLSFFITSASLVLASLLIPRKTRFRRESLWSLLALVLFAIGVTALLRFQWMFMGLLRVFVLPGAILLGANFYRSKKPRRLVRFFDYLMILLGFSVFFAVYEQSATSFMTVALSKSFATHASLPVTSLQLLDPAANILLGMLFVVLWNYSSLQKLARTAHLRFALGFFIAIPALLVLRLSAAAESSLPFFILFSLSTVIFVISEQLIIPSGFSETTRVGEAENRAALLGVWYLTVAYSEQLNAAIGKYLIGSEKGVDHLVATYGRGILELSVICLALGLAHLICWRRFQN